ncbi:MAG: cupredoxin domain-containing protein [bacterium]
MDKQSKQNLMIIVSVIIAMLIIFFAINYTNKDQSVSVDDSKKVEQNVNNVSIVDGKQIIEIKAKDGFNPVHSVAKAGIPTILRVETNGTFDCSSSISIPEMNISRSLPLSGTTDIDVGTQQAGTFNGTCSMGMYPFDIKFE